MLPHKILRESGKLLRGFAITAFVLSFYVAISLRGFVVSTLQIDVGWSFIFTVALVVNPVVFVLAIYFLWMLVTIGKGDRPHPLIRRISNRRIPIVTRSKHSHDLVD